MLPHLRYLDMHIRDTGLVEKACKCLFSAFGPSTDDMYSNPMLAETFEDVRMKFIAEKVRHNPLEIAYHAEGSNWELTSTSCGKTKFWG